MVVTNRQLQDARSRMGPPQPSAMGYNSRKQFFTIFKQETEEAPKESKQQV